MTAKTAQSKAAPYPAGQPTQPVCHKAHETDPGTCAGPKNSSKYFSITQMAGEQSLQNALP